MTAVARLLTLVDLMDQHDEGTDARRLDVSARLEAVLADGRRIVLLHGRGWSELGHIDWDHEPTGGGTHATSAGRASTPTPPHWRRSRTTSS